MLPEIQRTGDIFFPLDWTSAVLERPQLGCGRQTVKRFLAAQRTTRRVCGR